MKQAYSEISKGKKTETQLTYTKNYFYEWTGCYFMAFCFCEIFPFLSFFVFTIIYNMSMKTFETSNCYITKNNIFVDEMIKT